MFTNARSEGLFQRRPLKVPHMFHQTAKTDNYREPVVSHDNAQSLCKSPPIAMVVSHYCALELLCPWLQIGCSWQCISVQLHSVSISSGHLLPSLLHFDTIRRICYGTKAIGAHSPWRHQEWLFQLITPAISCQCLSPSASRICLSVQRLSAPWLVPIYGGQHLQNVWECTTPCGKCLELRV